MSPSLSKEGFLKYFLYTNFKISRSASPIFLLEARYSSNTLISTGGTYIISDALLGGEEGTGGSELAAGVRAGGGQPGSNAGAGCSLGLDKPFEP
jgi:hypothetical protein